MTESVDWHALEEHLFEQTNMVIKQFAEEHPESLCSFFASEPENNVDDDSLEGNVHIVLWPQL